MEIVLLCVAPDADYALYELLGRQFRGAGWDSLVMPVDEFSGARASLPRFSAAVAHATDWPDAQLHGWLSAMRSVIGRRRRILALLPRPPASYPEVTQMLWNRALGYGHKISEAVEIVDGFLAGR